MSELIFEKDYELLQEITYPNGRGGEAKTKSVVLKAATFKQGEKIEAALRQIDPITSIVKFISDNGLITTKDGVNITSPLLSDLHIKAYRALANDYCKFFLTSELSEEAKNFVV